jgi:competence protein ComEC
MKALKYPLVPIVLFLALGILVGYNFSPAKSVVFTVVLFAVAGFTTSFVYSQRSLLQRPYFLVATCLLSFSSGMVLHWLHFAPNNPKHYSHILSNESPVIKGVIAERLKPNDYYEKYFFKIQSVDGKPAAGKLLVSVPIDSLNQKLHGGQVIIIADDLQPISKPLNPYQFDYSEYMAKQNVFHQIRLKDNYVVAGTEQNFNFYIDRLRTNLINSFDIHNYTHEVKNIIYALLLGQRQDMDKATTDNYTNAGVIHILAISGLHFATLFYIFNLLLKPLRRYKRKGMLLQLLAVLTLLWTFAFITGLSASVVRSVVMFSFVAIGQYSNRNSNIINSLALSMLVLLLAKPAFLFDVGFQLSYAAVFAIVWLQPLYKRVKPSKHKVVNYLADTVIVSLVAQLGVLPLSLYYFNQFPLLFLLANIIVIPLSTAILLLGIVVLVLNFIFPSLAIVLGNILSHAITLMNNFIEWIASFDHLVLKDISFTLVLNITLYIIIILLVRWMYKRSYARTAMLLSSLIVFQLAYTLTALRAQSGNEMVIFQNRKATILAVKEAEQIAIYSRDSMVAETSVVKEYSKENFNDTLFMVPLENVMWFNNKRILVLDSLAIEPGNANPDILVLTQSPKVNLERLLAELKPTQVIADGTNYKSYVARWQATCTKANIPFHSTGEKGFFKID